MAVRSARRSLSAPVRAAWLVVDVVMVAGFVLIGRAEHDDEGASSNFVEVAAPFLLTLVAGWLVTRAWRRPLAWQTGVGVWATTLVVGMVLRRTVFDDGTAVAFVIVAAVFLGVTLMGWRFFARRMS